MKIYLAAQFRQQAEMRRCREDLKKAGLDVTSRWLEEEFSKGTKDPFNDARIHASYDLEDVMACDLFVLFTEDPNTATLRGGRHFESGYAYALHKPILLVGPRENIFHYLPEVLTAPSWTAALKLLKGMKNGEGERQDNVERIRGSEDSIRYAGSVTSRHKRQKPRAQV